MAFLGRARELDRLRAFYESDEDNLAIVTGRRRVGKTALIRASLSEFEGPAVFLQCKATSLASNVRNLMELAKPSLGLDLTALEDFEQALKLIFEAVKERPAVLVLDNYPNLQSLLPDCDTLLQSLTDEYRAVSRLKLVLCATTLESGDGVLAARADAAVRLEPMDYYDAALFYPNFTNEDKVRLYSVFGGMPYCSARIDDSLSVKENIIGLIASPDAAFASEPELRLHLEFPKIRNAVSVLDAVSSGASKFKDILDRSRLSSSTVLAEVLRRLCEIGLLRKVCPINQTDNKKRITYAFEDHLIGFYYRYVYRFLSPFYQLSSDAFFDQYIAEDFELNYVPKNFAEICAQFVVRMNSIDRYNPPFFKIGSYSCEFPKERKSRDFAVVAEGPAGRTVFKSYFTKHLMTLQEISEEIAPASASSLHAAHYVFISRSGFESFDRPDNVSLYTLDDLYAPI